MKEEIHGFPVGQAGLAYYNILGPSTQGTNQVGTNHQEAAPAGSGDVQTVQGSSEQTQGTTQYQVISRRTKSEPGDQFWHIRPHTVVGSKNSTIDSKDP